MLTAICRWFGESLRFCVRFPSRATCCNQGARILANRAASPFTPEDTEDLYPEISTGG